MSDTKADKFPFERFDESNFKTYHGSCHCGTVKFDVAISPPIEEGTVMSCNCSICHANGYLNVYAPDRKMTFLPDRETAMKQMTGYKFGKQILDHYFCKTCGTSLVAGRTTKVGKCWEIFGPSTRAQSPTWNMTS